VSIHKLKKNLKISKSLNMKTLTIVVLFLMTTTIHTCADHLPQISVLTNDNQLVELIPELLDTFKEIPIRNTRDRINRKYQDPNFFRLYMLNLNHVENNEFVKFKIKNSDIPVRISFLSINQKTSESDRILVSHGSIFLDSNKEIEANTRFFHYYENMNFIVAERVSSIHQVSDIVKNLKLIREAGYLIKIEYGTNWTMSELKLELDVTVENNNTVTREITFDELINSFSSPQWVIAIRTSQID